MTSIAGRLFGLRILLALAASATAVRVAVMRLRAVMNRCFRPYPSRAVALSGQRRNRRRIRAGADRTHSAESGVRRRKGAEPADKPGSVVDNHSSRPCVAARLKQHTRVRTEPIHRTPIWPCSEWGLPCPAALAPQAVGSYPTGSPLPRALAGRSAVCFLLHWPSACAAQSLPGTLLCGARTFLGACATRLSGRLRQMHCRTVRLNGRVTRRRTAPCAARR